MASPGSGGINFTRGVPPLDVLPVAELAKCAMEVLDEQCSQVFQYPKVGGNLGDPELRQGLGQFCGVAPDRIFVSNGSLQVLDLLACLLLDGADRVVYVEAPTYDRASRVFRRRGGRVVGIPLQRDGMDLDALRAAVRREVPAFVYVIPDFQNPSGICLSAEKRQALIALAEAYGFMIVEDMPYRELRYHGADLPSLASLGEGRVVSLGSLSKILTPGLRIGYAVADHAVCLKLAALAENTYLSPAPLTQATAAKSFQYDLVSPAIAHARRFLAPRHDAAVAAAAATFEEGLMAVPGGGYFVGVLIEGDIDEAELLNRAGIAGVMLSPGSAFFPDAASARGTLFLRLPFQGLTAAEFAEGVNILGDIVAALRR